NRSLIRQLRQGDVSLDDVEVARTKDATFGLMGKLTAATNREIALIRTQEGLVLRMGQSGTISAAGAIRVIAHTHPSAILGISADDFTTIFLSRLHKSTIVVGPKGFWRRYASNQVVLGGNL